MKRSGDDLPSGSQSEKPQLTKTSREKMEEDASAFLKEVQETFKDEKEKRDMFYDVMEDNHAQRIDPATFTSRVLDIIKGHTNLIDGFNAILPVGKTNFSRGYVFCEKVVERLGSKYEFQKFTDTLYSIRSVDTITKQKYLFAEMNCMLKDHQDLMDEFKELWETGYLNSFVFFRKLVAMGYIRSPKKCREKFEYRRRTKELGQSNLKNHRFFDQLEALQSHNSSPQPPPQQQQQQQQQKLQHFGIANTNISFLSTPPGMETIVNPSNVAPPAPLLPISVSKSPDLLLDSTSLSTSSDSDLGKKRKRKWKEAIERLMNEIVSKQEEMQRKFIEELDKHERERITREEAWRAQEMERVRGEREQEMERVRGERERLAADRERLAADRAISAAKDNAVMEFLRSLSDKQSIDQERSLNPPRNTSQMQNSERVMSFNLTPQPQPQPQRHIEVNKLHETQNVVQEKSLIVSPTPPPVNLIVSETESASHVFSTTRKSRWTKIEIQDLINLRIKLEAKYQESALKVQVWEEISSGLRELGHERSAQRCKEKWDSIKKYFKKVKESSRKRPKASSNTCPYFHQLDALYGAKYKGQENSCPNLAISENSIPLMVLPEQQWPPLSSEVERFRENDNADETRRKINKKTRSL